MTTVSTDDVAQPLRTPEIKKGSATHSPNDGLKFALELAQQGKAEAGASRTATAAQNPVLKSLWSESLSQAQDQSQNAVVEQGQDKNMSDKNMSDIPNRQATPAALNQAAAADSSTLFATAVSPKSPTVKAESALAQIISPVSQTKTQSGKGEATVSDAGQNSAPVSQTSLSQTAVSQIPVTMSLWPDALPQGQNPVRDQGQGKSDSSSKDVKNRLAAKVSQIAATDNRASNPASGSGLLAATMPQTSSASKAASGHASKSSPDVQGSQTDANLSNIPGALSALGVPMAIAAGSNTAGTDNSLIVLQSKLAGIGLDSGTTKDTASADKAGMVSNSDDGSEGRATPVTLLVQQLKSSEQGQGSTNQNFSSSKPHAEIAVLEHATHLPVETQAGQWLQETALSNGGSSSSATPVDGAAQAAQDNGVAAPQLDVQRTALRTLDLALTGPDLGPLAVKMRLRGDRLNVDISSTRADSVSAMMRDHSVLSEALVGAGYQLDSLNMQVTAPAQSQSGGATTSSGQGPAPRQQEGHSNSMAGSTAREQNDEKQNQSAGAQAASPPSSVVPRSRYYI